MPAKRVSKQSVKGQSSSFRIIAGQWRGRRLAFPDNTTVRPTGDRVRETVFNWLQPYLHDAIVWDLFAGSGALGLEALSRGARQLTLVEKDSRLVRALKDNIKLLGTEADVVTADVVAWLTKPSQSADLVFMDPPYPAVLWPVLLEKLRQQCLNEGALVYTEQPTKDSLLSLPPEFELLKQRTAGQVRFMLLRYQSVNEVKDSL